RGPRLRVLPRPVDVPRPRHRLLLQAADGRAARAEPLPARGQVDRHQQGPGHRGEARSSRRVRGGDAVSPVDAPVAAPKQRGPFGRLYHGETRIDFVGRTKVWFGLSALFLLIGIVSMFTRGLNLGIDFEGGAVYEVPTATMTVQQATDAVTAVGISEPKVQELQGQSGRFIRVQTSDVDPTKATQITT